MKYCSYIISKYNPKYFDEFGIYKKEEWTSKYDIGKVFDKQKLTEQEYLRTEDKYVLAVRYILQEFGISKLVVSKLERHASRDEEENGYLKNPDIFKCMDGINEGTVLDRNDADCIIRALLRDYVWCELYSRDKHFVLSAGYDYYMHLICEELTHAQKNHISAMGLFVTEDK